MRFPSDEEANEFYADHYRLNETGPDYPLGSHRRTHVLRSGRQFALIMGVIKHHQRYLDYGCALGWSVHAAEFMGLEAYGVELGKSDREFALNEWGLVLHPTLEDLPVRDFDLVLMSHVLEHFIDPIAELKKLRDEYMADFARIIIEVPTVASPSAWSAFHAVLFNNKSLALCLEKAGFEVELMRSHENAPGYPVNLMWAVGKKNES